MKIGQKQIENIILNVLKENKTLLLEDAKKSIINQLKLPDFVADYFVHNFNKNAFMFANLFKIYTKGSISKKTPHQEIFDVLKHFLDEFNYLTKAINNKKYFKEIKTQYYELQKSQNIERFITNSKSFIKTKAKEVELKKKEKEEIQARRKSKERDKNRGEIMLEFPDGHYWFNTERKYCEQEKEEMDHCGTARCGYIISLRDKNHDSKVTIDYNSNDNIVCQLRGKKNSEVGKKYKRYVLAFFEKYNPDYDESYYPKYLMKFFNNIDDLLHTTIIKNNRESGVEKKLYNLIKKKGTPIHALIYGFFIKNDKGIGSIASRENPIGYLYGRYVDKKPSNLTRESIIFDYNNKIDFYFLNYLENGGYKEFLEKIIKNKEDVDFISKDYENGDQNTKQMMAYLYAKYIDKKQHRLTKKIAYSDNKYMEKYKQDIEKSNLPDEEEDLKKSIKKRRIKEQIENIILGVLKETQNPKYEAMELLKSYYKTKDFENIQILADIVEQYGLSKSDLKGASLPKIALEHAKKNGPDDSTRSVAVRIGGPEYAEAYAIFVDKGLVPLTKEVLVNSKSAKSVMNIIKWHNNDELIKQAIIEIGDPEYLYKYASGMEDDDEMLPEIKKEIMSLNPGNVWKKRYLDDLSKMEDDDDDDDDWGDDDEDLENYNDWESDGSGNYYGVNESIKRWKQIINESYDPSQEEAELYGSSESNENIILDVLKETQNPKYEAMELLSAYYKTKDFENIQILADIVEQYGLSKADLRGAQLPKIATNHAAENGSDDATRNIVVKFGSALDNVLYAIKADEGLHPSIKDVLVNFGNGMYIFRIAQRFPSDLTRQAIIEIGDPELLYKYAKLIDKKATLEINEEMQKLHPDNPWRTAYVDEFYQVPDIEEEDYGTYDPDFGEAGGGLYDDDEDFYNPENDDLYESLKTRWKQIING